MGIEMNKQTSYQQIVRLVFLSATFLMVAISNGSLFAQQTKTIRGNIKTPSGTPAKNATIVFTSTLLGQEPVATTSDEQGNFKYELPSGVDLFVLRIGIYHPSGVITGKIFSGVDAKKQPLSLIHI